MFVKETKRERITDTIVFQHKPVTNPVVSQADTIVSAAADLTDAIKGNMKKSLDHFDIKELERLAQIFAKTADKIGEREAQAPRVQERTQPPRVREPSATPRVTPSQEEQNATEGATAPRVDADGPNHGYNTRHQKRLFGSITAEAMMTIYKIDLVY